MVTPTTNNRTNSNSPNGIKEQLLLGFVDSLNRRDSRLSLQFVQRSRRDYLHATEEDLPDGLNGLLRIELIKGISHVLLVLRNTIIACLVFCSRGNLRFQTGFQCFDSDAMEQVGIDADSTVLIALNIAIAIIASSVLIVILNSSRRDSHPH